MAKRRLTKQQQRRIQQNIENFGESEETTYGKLRQGLVVCHYGKHVDIEDSLNNIVKCNLRQNLPNIAVGDQAIYELTHHASSNNNLDNNNIKINVKTGIVSKVLPRKSLLIRTNLNKASSKPIAANLDQIFIIFAIEPKPQSYLIDQFLIIAENCKLEPILILNKYDLFDKLSRKAEQQEILELIQIYQDIGYKVLTISGLYDKNYTVLNKLLADRTSIFVGQSGVGKSTITQKLVPNIEILTGAISEKSQLGKHTTTTAKLYHLDNNADLIDAPGIREMGVAHLGRTEIEEAYIEFRPFLGQCKFNDCAHEKEPDCALKQALSEQKISQVRWQNYKKFV